MESENFSDVFSVVRGIIREYKDVTSAKVHN